jgi:hypothetical protein
MSENEKKIKQVVKKKRRRFLPQSLVISQSILCLVLVAMVVKSGPLRHEFLNIMFLIATLVVINIAYLTMHKLANDLAAELQTTIEDEDQDNEKDAAEED